MSDHDSFSAAWNALVLKDEGHGINISVKSFDDPYLTYEESRRLHDWLGQRLWLFDEAQRNKRKAG